MKAIIDTSTGKYIDVNDSLLDFLERTKEEMLGRTSVEINNRKHSERWLCKRAGNTA
jgi:PAS domain-containing protein